MLVVLRSSVIDINSLVNYNLVLGGVDALPGNEDGGSNEDII
jgi:hypothetical protein